MGETELLPHTPSQRENHMICRRDDFNRP